MKTSDGQLISDYLEGNERALSILVDRYLKDVYNFAYRLTHNKQAAEDVAQESFIKAWKHIRRYRQDSDFKTWIFTIARNTAIDWLRQKKEIALSAFENEEGENVLLATLKDTKPLPDELIARAEDAAYVRALLSELNPEYREVLELRYSSNLTFEEIGNILKRPLHTVKSQHRRAIAILRRSIQIEPA